MEYRFGKYGNKVSNLGFGCMRFAQSGGKIEIRKQLEKAKKELETPVYKNARGVIKMMKMY